MNPEDKISPAFEPVLAGSRRRDKHEAVVFYRTAADDEPKTRNRTRSRLGRLRLAEEKAAYHKEVESRIFDDYRESTDASLAVSPIGASTLPAATVEVTVSTLYDLASQPDVVAILPNQRIHLIKPCSIDYYELARYEIRLGHTWGLEQLGVPALWSKTRGKDIKVGVLDTGVFGNHPVFSNTVTDYIVIDPLGRRIQATPTFDAGIHGTHVCGTIAGGQTPEGVSVGVAPEAKLCVGGVLVGDATLRTLLEGIDWTIEQGVDIINMSLGFSYYEPLFAEIFTYLIEQYNVLPVVAIGNENQGNSSSPGNAHNALGVGALEKMNRGRLDVAFFSSGASLVFPGSGNSNVVTKPDVVAPGVQVYSAIPPVIYGDSTYYYLYMDGTSMATPHLSGVVALLMSAYPKTPITQIVQAIKETAEHPMGGAYRPDNRWGWGIVQPEAAYKALKG